MNANRIFSVLVVGSLVLCSGLLHAEQGLDSSSQTKVNNAKAKAWSNSTYKQRDPALDKRQVNIGSRRGGDCSMNVGTAQTGQTGGRAPKDIVVTTKEVINICK